LGYQSKRRNYYEGGLYNLMGRTFQTGYLAKERVKIKGRKV